MAFVRSFVRSYASFSRRARTRTRSNRRTPRRARETAVVCTGKRLDEISPEPKTSRFRHFDRRTRDEYGRRIPTFEWTTPSANTDSGPSLRRSTSRVDRFRLSTAVSVFNVVKLRREILTRTTGSYYVRYILCCVCAMIGKVHKNNNYIG